LYTVQGYNEGEQGVGIPRAPNHYGGAESLRWAPNDGGGDEKSQQCRKYLLQ